MIYKQIVLLFTMCVFAFSADAQTRSHTVVSQETLYGISKEYGISIEDLKKLNPELNEGLKEGMLLKIPDLKASTPETAVPEENPLGLKIHLVEDGETLYSLSLNYKTTPEAIKEVNNGMEEGLKAGEEIFIPNPSKEPITEAEPRENDFFYHTVKAGETAYSLSKKFKISLDSLYILNPNAVQGLQIGFQLKLPKNREDLKSNYIQPRGGLTSDETKFADENKAKRIPKGEEHFLYQIKVGDSFFSLKKEYGVGKEELIALNPELAEGIELDKYIIIPRAGKDAVVEQKSTGWLDKLFNKVDSTGTASAPIIFIPQDSLRPETKPKAMKTIREIGRDYKISLLLPFTIPADSVRNNSSLKAFENTGGNLDPDLIDLKKTGKPKLDRSTLASIEFYNGLMLAIDSFSKMGMPLDVKVFDTRNNKGVVRSFVDSLKADQPDLVIGPLFKSNVEYIADELGEDGIMVISPLSRTVSAESRPNLIQCIPGEESSAAKMAEIINRDFSNSNIIFAHTGTSRESRAMLAIKGRLLAREDASYMGDLTFTSEMLKRNQLKEVVSSKKRNVFTVVSEDKVFLSDLINKLRQLRDTSIYILASGKVKDIATLETEYLNKLNLTMVDGFFVDYQDSITLDFIGKYRDTFATEPSSYSFQGYDIGMLFLKMLWENEAQLNGALQMDSIYRGLQTGFHFTKEEYKGYQNDFLFHTGIRKMTLVRFEEQAKKEATPVEPLPIEIEED